MRFTWGHGITIGIVAFMAFILSMVFRAHQNPSDLTSRDYYMKELAYQDEIDAKRNAQQLPDTLGIVQTDSEVILSYPFTGEVSKKIEGQVLFYRPNNNQFDRIYKIKADKNLKQRFFKSNLVQGLFIIKVSWKLKETSYYIEKPLEIY